MTHEEFTKLEILTAYTGRPLTDQQKEFASNFNRDVISFSDPGTGKTHSLIMGLLMAQDYHKVPGSRINCMSFTNAAVSEMAGRYEVSCKRCGLTPTVKFNTFHSLSLRILEDAYPRMKTTDNLDLESNCKIMESYMIDLGIDKATDRSYQKKVLKVIDELNSALCFHPSHVALKYNFLTLGMDINDFQELRLRWFDRGRITNKIVQGDIPLYCLYALMRDPELGTKWKGVYEIMVVDEFQDLSLLHLRILSYIANKLVVIGDMKQQIYIFNGACPQIVKEYMRLHPDAVSCPLNQSFRCGQHISEFATNIIRPNDETIEPFIGKDDKDSVEVITRRDLNWKQVCYEIAEDQRVNQHNAQDIMFLYRNNASAIPIIEELYQLGVPFQCTKFQQVMETPMFKELCILANAAWQPSSNQFVMKALRLFPEFSGLSYGETPAPLVAMFQSGKDLLNIKYKYKERSSYEIIAAMTVAREKILERKSAGVVLMKLMDVYDKYIIKGQWWRLDNEKEFYLNLVAPICNSKEYPTMYNEEIAKAARNAECIKAKSGVRCYTMHSAKGLEADVVYILDCDDGLFPNAKKLKQKISAGCYYDAAEDVRSERNLLYVGATRAKKKLVVTYSSPDSLTKLIANPYDPQLTELDEYYNSNAYEFDDAGEFFKLFKVGGKND